MRHYYVVMMPRPFNYALHLKCLLFDVLPCQWGTRMQWIINIGIDYYSKSQKVEFFYWLDITLAHYQFQSQTSVLCLTLHIGSWSCIYWWSTFPCDVGEYFHRIQLGVLVRMIFIPVNICKYMSDMRFWFPWVHHCHSVVKKVLNFTCTAFTIASW